MKFLQWESRELFVWAHLRDQNSHDADTNPLLGEGADLRSPRENAARLELLQTRRSEEILGLHTARLFASVLLEPHDILLAHSAWRGVGFRRIASEFARCHALKLARTDRFPQNKDVEAMMRGVKRAQRALAQPIERWPQGLGDRYDIHRSIWVWPGVHGDRWGVLDGTHRLIALTYHYILEARPWPEIRALVCGPTLPIMPRHVPAVATHRSATVSVQMG